MMMPLTPSNKNNLVAILTASCDPNNFGGTYGIQITKTRNGVWAAAD